MPNTIIFKTLEESINNLEDKINESESKLKSINSEVSKKTLNRFYYYREMISKQRQYLKELKTTDDLYESYRLINLINSLSTMLKNDAESIINEIIKATK